MFEANYSLYMAKYSKLRVMVNSFGSLEIISEMLGKVMVMMGFFRETFGDTL